MGKIAVIAEKEKVAKAVAEALNKKFNFPIQTRKNYIEVGNYSICWANGHIMKLKEIEDYNSNFKKWNLQDLPIFFENWEKVPMKEKKYLFDIIGNCLKDSESAIHCGDPDDEGQFIVDELLEYYKYKKPVKRLCINDTTVEVIIKELDRMKDNKEYIAFGKSAYARAVSDNLYGKNLSRFFTLKNANPNVVLAVGRVQTPTLALVVERDRLIENHQKVYFYNFNANLKENNIKLTYVPKEKIINENIANDMLNYFKQDKFKNVEVVVSKKKKNEAPPLPFNLNTLQSEAGKKFGYNPDEVLKISQSLRDNYDAITYNRSSCSYLGEEYFEQAPLLLPTIIKNIIPYFKFNEKIINTSIKSPCFDNSKTTVHQGIIPTNIKISLDKFNEKERNLYLLIAKRYLMQFVENAEIETTNISFEIPFEESDCKFSTSKSEIKKLGYKEINGLTEEDLENEDTSITKIPSGTYNWEINDYSSVMGETKPLARFSQTTLADEMNAISKYIKDPEIKKIFLEKDEEGGKGSIGTPATQSKIITGLIEKGYLREEEAKGKSKLKPLISTELGREYLNSLPYECKSLDTTALWWLIQEDISVGKKDEKELIHKVLDDVKGIMKNNPNFKLNSNFTNKNSTIPNDTSNLKEIGNCPLCNGKVLKKQFTYKEKETGKDVKVEIFTCENTYPNKTCDYSVNISQGFGIKIKDTEMKRLLKGIEVAYKAKKKDGTEFEANFIIKKSEAGYYSLFISSFKNEKSKTETEEKTEMICPITRNILLKKPQKKDPTKYIYTPENHNYKTQPIIYVINEKTGKLYELNTKKEYDIIKA